VAQDPEACRIEASLAADERYRAGGPIVRAFPVRPRPDPEPKPEPQPEPKPEPQPEHGAEQPAPIPENIPPTAVPGGPYEVNEGEPVELDGSGSVDPDGSIVAYRWTREDRLDDPTAKRPVFTAHDDEVFDIELTVTDDRGASHTVSTNIKVRNVDPKIAELGPFTATVGAEVALNGIAIRDPGGKDSHEIAVDWGDGTSSPATIHEDGSVTATHAYAAPGDYLTTLTVRDDDGGTGSQQTIVSVLAIPA
jgi:hypothetical protein